MGARRPGVESSRGGHDRRLERRQQDGECTSRSGLAADVNAASVLLNNGPRDGKPQSAAVGLAGGIGAVEGFEDVCNVLSGYADARIGHAQMSVQAVSRQ